MKIVGLITEYNPFHNGHKYHIEQAKKLTGADAAIVVMSGNIIFMSPNALARRIARIGVLKRSRFLRQYLIAR